MLELSDGRCMNRLVLVRKVREARTISLTFNWGLASTNMCCEDLNYILQSRSKSYSRRRNTLSNEPIASEESRRSAIEGISEHGTLLNWPFRQYRQSSSKYATVVEFTVWQYVFRLLSNTLIVLLGPTLL